MKRFLFPILAITFAASALFAAPSPRLEELHYFDGHWVCKGTAFAFMGMPEHKTTATIDGTWMLNG